MPNVQRRLPGVQWSAFSTQRPSAFGSRPQAEPAAPTGTPLRTAAQIATARTAGIPPGGPFTPPKAPISGQPQAQPAQPQTGYGGAKVGPAFATKGIGRYVSRNGNSLQFNRPAVMNAIHAGVQAYGEAQYFRHSGFGAALRHTLGMPQMPSHMNDYLRARHNTATRPGRNDPNWSPHSITAQLGSVDPDAYSHWDPSF